MKLITRSLAISLLLVASAASAATINLGGPTGNRLGVQSAAGGTVASNPLLTAANSYYITIGNFATAPVFVTGGAQVDFDAIKTSFVSLKTSLGANVTVGAADGGLLGGGFTGVGPTSLNSTAVYFLITNTANYADATELAVLRASTLLFPNPVTAGTTVSATSSITGLAQIVGVVTDSTRDYVTLVKAVPEPSVALLGALGALGLIRRRR